jgi:hypothetical protein
MSLLDTASLLLTPNAYKEGKLYSVIPSDGSGDFTFTRATTATRVNSDGLVELVPYNLVQYSQDFSNAAWTKDLSSITYNQPDPFGGNNAALCTFTNLATSRIAQQLSIVAGNTYTLSAWIKGVNVTDFRFLLGTNQVVLVTSQIVNGEWVRVSATVTATTTGGYQQSPARSNNTNGESFYIYGAQLVEGTNELPYQKTETRLNIPRLDYSLGGCPNILLEPQRTNLVFYSEDFSNAYWTKQAGITATYNTTETLSPDGTYNATKFVGNGTTGVLKTSISVSGVVSRSVYLKSVTGTTTATFKEPNTNVPSPITLTITNEWQRFEMIGDNGSSLQGLQIDDITSDGIYMWGAQLEAGSYATSYIPTTTASVTRNRDQCVKTGISSLINSAEGVLYVEINALANDLTFRTISLSSDTNLNRIRILYNTTTNNVSYQIRNTSGVLLSDSDTVTDIKDTIKIAIKYKSTDFAVWLNGVEVATSSSVGDFSSDILNNFSFDNGSGFDNFYGNVKALALWPTALTDDELATLTTI